MKEQGEDEGSRRRSKAKTKELDEDGGERRR